MDEEYMLSTIDNPYNPFTAFDEWYAWDTRAGYHTLGLLGRIVRTADDLSYPDQNLAITLAIDEIVFENVYGVHLKVERDYVPIPMRDQVA